MFTFSLGEGWLKPSLLALSFWGLWGFLTKLSADKVPWQTMMIYYAACTLLLGALAKPSPPVINLPHFIGLLSGLACAAGFLYFYIAMSRGPASVVIPLTSMYLAPASILAFVLLSEPVTLKKIIGVLCALAAVILLAG